MRKLLALGAIFAVLCVTGCRKVDSKAAVETAVQNHLNHNAHLMLNSFSTHFEAVTVQGDTAQALVKYDSKNMPNVAVEVSYVLKKENGQWQVISSSSAGGQLTNPANPHAGLTMDQTPAPGEKMPAPIPSH